MITARQLQQAARIIRAGGLVIFPTETVYGLGANALNSAAVKKIFQVKGRPSNNPLIVHIADLNQLDLLTTQLPPNTQKVIDHSWPGPLTLILPKSPLVPSEVTGGGDTIAVRMPNHPTALELIRASKVPIAAPSANTSGYLSPTNYLDVYADLGDKVDLVLDGGDCEVGLESTVLDLTSEIPTILRPGAITASDLQPILGKVNSLSQKPAITVKSPGLLYKHYSPKTPLLLVKPSQTLATIQQNSSQRIGILTTTERLSKMPSTVIALSLGSKNNLAEIAQNLFASLHQLDRMNVDLIIVESVPKIGIGLAIMNRLERAAQKN